MRCRAFFCLFIMIIALAFSAGTAVSAPAKPLITADKTYYDIESGLYILSGHVYIEVRDRIITAGQAKVSLSSMEVWGSCGITLTQGDIKMTADSVHVFGAQNKALIEGGVTFRRTDLAVAADRAEFDWKTKLGVFSGNVKVTQKENTWQTPSLTYNVATAEIITGL